MDEEVRKIKGQLAEFIARIDRQEQRLMSLEREIAEQAINHSYDNATAEFYGEPIVQRATHRQTFYIPKKQRNIYRITRIVGVVISIGFLLWYTALIVV